MELLGRPRPGATRVSPSLMICPAPWRATAVGINGACAMAVLYSYVMKNVRLQVIEAQNKKNKAKKERRDGVFVGWLATG